MKVIQLSDLHLRGDGQLSYRVADTKTLLDNCIKHIKALPWQADILVITGDLAEGGQVGGYELLQKCLALLDMPIYLLPGNHDKRENLLQILGKYCPADSEIAPHLCYTIENLPMRLIFLDSTMPKSHSGHLKPSVAGWLKSKLSQFPDKPTLLFTHHPPFLSGFGKMDEPYENAQEFSDILSSYSNVRLCCGHMHRNITTMWANNLALTCPAVSMQIELDLSPKGGAAFRMETPAYLIHHFENGFCNTHTCQIPSHMDFSGPHLFATPT